jgi:hypothetical protein
MQIYNSNNKLIVHHFSRSFDDDCILLLKIKVYNNQKFMKTIGNTNDVVLYIYFNKKIIIIIIKENISKIYRVTFFIIVTLVEITRK